VRHHAGAGAIVGSIVELTFVFPGPGQLAAAHGLERQRQLADGAHRVEHADRVVEPVDGDQRGGAVVLDGGDLGPQRAGVFDEGEGGVRIVAGLERDARPVVEPGDALGGVERASVEPGQDALGGGEPARRDVATGARQVRRRGRTGPCRRARGRWLLLLRRVGPGELGLRWVARGREGGGLGGKAERGEQATRAGRISDQSHDAAAAAAVAAKDVLGEHATQQVSPRQSAGA
jgi:hypothetical protein